MNCEEIRRMTLTGGCQCGAVSYEVAAEPLRFMSAIAANAGSNRRPPSAFPSSSLQMRSFSDRDASRPGPDRLTAAESSSACSASSAARASTMQTRGMEQSASRVARWTSRRPNGCGPHLDITEAAGRDLTRPSPPISRGTRPETKQIEATTVTRQAPRAVSRTISRGSRVFPRLSGTGRSPSSSRQACRPP